MTPRWHMPIWQFIYFRHATLILRPRRPAVFDDVVFHRATLPVVGEVLVDPITRGANECTGDRFWNETPTTRVRVHCYGYTPVETEIPNSAVLRCAHLGILEALPKPMPEAWLREPEWPSARLRDHVEGRKTALPEIVVDRQDKATKGRQLKWEF